MKKSFMTRVLASGLSLAMAFSMAAATNVTTASAASKPKMIQYDGSSAKNLSVKLGESVKIKVNAATQAKYKVSAVKVSSSKLKATKNKAGTVVKITGAKATEEGKPASVKVSFKVIKTGKASKYSYVSKVNVIEDKLTVTGVTATNATTLTVTGTKLGDLTAADVKVTPAISVASYVAAEDGKTATVTLASAMMSATKYTVEIIGQSFEVSYTTGEITSVAITETTYDDDTAGQVLAITVNGGSPITVNDLVADGYYVNFSATKNGAAKRIFAGTGATTASGAAVSTTGELVKMFKKTTNTTYPDALIDSYQVQVVLQKGSSIITSPLATIKIANLNASATEIKSYEFTGATANSTISGVALTANTLVVGEKAKLTKAVITTKNGSVELPSAVLSLVSITSSDKGVISVDTSNGTGVFVEAMAPGTATLTFAYGSVTKTATYTVTNVARKVNAVAAKDSVVRVTESGAAATTKIVVKDQYGEFYYGLPVESAANAPVAGSDGIVYTSDARIATTSAVTGTKTDKKGEFAVTVKGVKQGSAYLMFSSYDANHNKTAYTAASIVVTTATAADSNKNQLYAVAKTNQSDDFTLDLFANKKDNKVSVSLKTFTKDGALVSSAALISGCSFKYNKAIVEATGAAVDTVTTAADGSTISKMKPSTTEVDFIANGKGSTTVSLYDQADKLMASVVITVNNTTPKLTAVAFNSVCPSSLTTEGEYVELAQVFNTKSSSNNTIIEGLTISEAYAGELRVDIKSATTAEIYIDTDSNGIYDGEDYIVGSINLTAKLTNGSTVSPTVANFKYTLTSAGGAAKTLYYTVYNCPIADMAATKVIATKTISVSL